MVIKGCTTIAEYAIRCWMRDQGFAEGYFTLEMSGNEGTVRDSNGDTLLLVYDSKERRVCVKEVSQTG